MLIIYAKGNPVTLSPQYSKLQDLNYTYGLNVYLSSYRK